MKLGPWIEDRCFWGADDLAAIIGKKKEGGIGWRVFSPENEPKFIQDGSAKDEKEARNIAMQILKNRYPHLAE